MANSISRFEKLEKLSNPYPRDFPGRETIKSLTHDFSVARDLKMLDGNITKELRKIAGRISARRGHKDNIFFDIFDQTNSIQLHAKKLVDGFDPPTWWTAVEEIDIGDMIGVEGALGVSRDGEPLLLIYNFITLAKALKDPPANFHGVKNPELKYRHREQDLFSSAETRELFKTRAQIVFEIRKYLNERDFVEIECPILQPIYGGATARPFKTSHNALGQDFFLSISSELYLKRAMVGGIDRVYSVSRCFRNEGISSEHNPEFTNLEIFETCKTADDMEIFTDKFIDHIAHSIGSLLPQRDFRSSMRSNDWPLSRKLSENDKYADAWELFINDMEIASGASDLNDPREQETRLKESEHKATAVPVYSGLKNEHSKFPPDYDPYDQNYIEALECGALPWAGVGIGIDRLVMLLTGHANIRDVILFPTLRQIPADD